jgi:soluble lytic murein transglycosylase
MGRARSGAPQGGWSARTALATAALAVFLACGAALLARSHEGGRSHEELAAAWAGEYGVEPGLVMAVIRCESGGRVDAVSPAGARGLMQIMPGTAAHVAAGLGLPAPDARDLLDPEINVRLGTRYLAELRKTFNDDHLALAAYNAGPANARKWAERCPGLDGATVVRREAFPQTRAYVDRVMREWKKGP